MGAVPHAVGTVILHVQAVEGAEGTAKVLVLGAEAAGGSVSHAQGANRTAVRAVGDAAAVNHAVGAWDPVEGVNLVRDAWGSAMEVALLVLGAVHAEDALVAEDAAGAVLHVDLRAEQGARGVNPSVDRGAKGVRDAKIPAKGSVEIPACQPVRGAREPAKGRVLDRCPIQYNNMNMQRPASQGWSFSNAKMEEKE